MSPEEIVRAAFQARRERLIGQSLSDWRANAPRLALALWSLTSEQGQRIAEDIWRDFDPGEDGYLLTQLGASVPGALTTIQAVMVERKVFYPTFLYLGADDTVAKKLIELISTPVIEENYNHLLLCLGWIGNERVVQQYQAWRENPPAWRSELYIPPSDYSKEAGWELTAEGTRRDLYLPSAYEVIALGESEQGQGSVSAFTILGAHEEHCDWCGHQLLTLLSIDLSDPRLAFLVLDGSRLRIAICPSCSYHAAVLTDIDTAGGSSWSDENGSRPSTLNHVRDDEDMENWPQQSFVLGVQRRTPFEILGRFMLSMGGISQIGGHPEWIDDATYPICPSCRRRMTFIAQLAWEDFDTYAEGATYAFVCLEDGKTATVYQQT
jgi:hypothetical protein